MSSSGYVRSITGRNSPDSSRSRRYLDDLLVVLRQREQHLPAADHSCGQRKQRIPGERAEVRREEDAFRPEQRLASRERRLADGVEHDVVRRAMGGEVLGRVVDDVVGAKARHERDVLASTHGGDGGSKTLRQLHRGGADRSGRPIDEDIAAGTDVGRSDVGERVVRTFGAGSSLPRSSSPEWSRPSRLRGSSCTRRAHRSCARCTRTPGHPERTR